MLVHVGSAYLQGMMAVRTQFNQVRSDADLLALVALLAALLDLLAVLVE